MARLRQEEARRIGRRIAELRERHHFTQQVAAERLRIGYRTYQTWELGEATPRWPNLRKLADLYGVEPDDILGTPQTPPDPNDAPLIEIRRELEAIRQELVALRRDLGAAKPGRVNDLEARRKRRG